MPPMPDDALPVRPTATLGRISLLVATLLLVGCGGPSTQEDAAFRKLFTTLHQLHDLMATVTDAKSAQAARPRLNSLMEEAHTAHLRVKAIPEDRLKVLYRRHATLVEEDHRKMSRQVERIIIRGDAPQMLMTYLLVTAEVKQ
jgi:hypothetical protein